MLNSISYVRDDSTQSPAPSQLENCTEVLRQTLDGLAEDINALRYRMGPVLNPIPLGDSQAKQKTVSEPIAPHLHQLEVLTDTARTLRNSVQDLTSHLCS